MKSSQFLSLIIIEVLLLLDTIQTFSLEIKVSCQLSIKAILRNPSLTMIRIYLHRVLGITLINVKKVTNVLNTVDFQLLKLLLAFQEFFKFKIIFHSKMTANTLVKLRLMMVNKLRILVQLYFLNVRGYITTTAVPAWDYLLIISIQLLAIKCVSLDCFTQFYSASCFFFL